MSFLLGKQQSKFGNGTSVKLWCVSTVHMFDSLGDNFTLHINNDKSKYLLKIVVKDCFATSADFQSNPEKN